MAKNTQKGSCETCTYYTYDEEYESYMCDVNMDEDEYTDKCRNQKLRLHGISRDYFFKKFRKSLFQSFQKLRSQDRKSVV